MKKLTVKNLRAVMERLDREDRESYNELYKAVMALWNLGLLEDDIRRAALEEDRRLFERE